MPSAITATQRARRSLPPICSCRDLRACSAAGPVVLDRVAITVPSASIWRRSRQSASVCSRMPAGLAAAVRERGGRMSGSGLLTTWSCGGTSASGPRHAAAHSPPPAGAGLRLPDRGSARPTQPIGPSSCHHRGRALLQQHPVDEHAGAEIAACWPVGAAGQAAGGERRADVPGALEARRREPFARAGADRCGSAARVQQRLLDQIAQQEAAIVEERVVHHAVRDEMDELVLERRQRRRWRRRS